MSDEEHHFESKADARASKTYPHQAGTIRKNGYIVIKARPCKVVEVSTSKTDDLRLPIDDSLLSQIKDGFAEGKDLVVSVMNVMGEEQICALKDIGPK
ncbi:hypothetical protein Dsin_000208 [Dipteronia sinensis]|uniref:Translation initiation factor 5A C-terminal domain-containing protein n=1 Tax=Dipteronia sinensis TaxID=43782 RepID=A0AAE0DI16_9ROSI|nr:hypothetical protein Dsin_000208 [Dipteronia sinensis]